MSSFRFHASLTSSNEDAATIYVDIQVSSEEVFLTPTFIQSPYSPPTTLVPSSLQRRRLPIPALQQSVLAIEFTEGATVYVDIQASAVEEHTTLDSATIYVNISNTGGECYSGFSGQMLGEGEATSRWRAGAYQARWSGEAQERWVLSGLSTESGC